MRNEFQDFQKRSRTGPHPTSEPGPDQSGAQEESARTPARESSGSHVGAFWEAFGGHPDVASGAKSGVKWESSGSHAGVISLPPGRSPLGSGLNVGMFWNSWESNFPKLPNAPQARSRAKSRTPSGTTPIKSKSVPKQARGRLRTPGRAKAGCKRESPGRRLGSQAGVMWESSGRRLGVIRTSQREPSRESCGSHVPDSRPTPTWLPAGVTSPSRPGPRSWPRACPGPGPCGGREGIS